ncbi:MAG: MFS transporter [Acholeplasmatales bacterium]|nr:MFS transporter [Acholeplasmatales bacterium]
MKNQNNIFIHKLLKSIADSIIIVFIPLYVLKTTNDFRLSMAYLIIYSLFVLFFMFVLKKLIQKYGVLAMILHFIPIIITEYILSFATINIWIIIICAGLMGLSQALYSIPLNLVFTFGDKKTNVGLFMIATNIGKIIFTLVSGFILSSEIKNSFLILSIASTSFYILSIFPILFAYKELKNNYDNTKNNNSETVKLNPWFIVFHISFGLFQPIMDNIVPLYLYMNDLSFQAVTIFIVVVEVLKVLANMISQIAVRHKKSIYLVSISFVLFFASIISIIFVKNNIALYILSTTASVSFPFTFVPMFGLYCNYLRKNNNVIQGITRRDFDIFSLRAPMYALSYIGFALLPCLILGVVTVPIMLLSEIKLLRSELNANQVK